MMLRAVADLPAPDSPTTPKTSPDVTVNDTEETAVTGPKRTDSSSTSNNGGLLTVGFPLTGLALGRASG